MKEKITDAILNLIKIKSLVTLATTAAFVLLSLSGTIEPDKFLTIFTIIIGFYFGTQKVKETETEGVITEPEQAAPTEPEVKTVYVPVQSTDSGIVYDAVYEPEASDGNGQQ